MAKVAARNILEKHAQDAARRLSLTDEDLKLLQETAYQVYEEIAYDLTPDNRKQRTCKRSTIMEVVIDANRLEHKVMEKLKIPTWRAVRTQEQRDADPPAVRACREYKFIQDLIGPAFPYDEYEAGPFQDEEKPAVSKARRIK